jgi:CRISPR/Cas system-associated exonuclease Cas4 (RecB family)
MLTNCSAGKGVLDHEDCLKCALAQTNPCGYDYSTLKAMFLTSEFTERQSTIHVTDLTGCLRKSWYDKVDPSPEYVHEGLARFIGTAVHGALEDSDSLMDCELPLSYAGLVGKADVVYKDGRVVDFKTTRWLYTSKVPYGSHTIQVNIYAYLLKKMGRDVNQLQIQYIDMSGPTKCRKCKVPVRIIDGEYRCPKCNEMKPNAHLGTYLVDVPISEEADIEHFIEVRKGDLTAAIAMGLPPAKEAGYLCAYCSHVDKCQPGNYEE